MYVLYVYVSFSQMAGWLDATSCVVAMAIMAGRESIVYSFALLDCGLVARGLVRHGT